MSKIEFTTSLHADKSTTTVTMPREVAKEIVPILAVIIKSLNNSLDRTPVSAEDKDLWDEDEHWPRSDWQSDVYNGDTSLGYWEWVEHNKDCATLEDAEDTPPPAIWLDVASGVDLEDCATSEDAEDTPPPAIWLDAASHD